MPSRPDNGDELTAEDVVFSFGPERMFGSAEAGQASGTLFTHTAGARGGASRPHPTRARRSPAPREPVPHADRVFSFHDSSHGHGSQVTARRLGLTNAVGTR